MSMTCSGAESILQTVGQRCSAPTHVGSHTADARSWRHGSTPEYAVARHAKAITSGTTFMSSREVAVRCSLVAVDDALRTHRPRRRTSRWAPGQRDAFGDVAQRIDHQGERRDGVLQGGNGRLQRLHPGRQSG
jgi:hypothetical protein